VILVDGEKLTKLMFETGLGLVTAGTYRVKRVNYEYFEEDQRPSLTADDADLRKVTSNA
jgi:hypothetical protein